MSGAGILETEVNVFMHNERIILEKVSEGDENAFRDLFCFYYPKAKTFLEQMISNSDDAMDIAQNIFVKIWLQRSILSDIKSFGAYLYTIIRNAAIDYGRTNKIKIPLEDIDNRHEIGQWHSESEFFAKEIQIQIAAAISKQPDKRRQVFIMSRMEGKSNGEIAQLLGISKKTVENHLNLVLKELRKIAKAIAIFFIPI